MAKLEETHLKLIFPTLSATKRKEYLPHINISMARFHIDTELRIAMYLAQLKHESSSLTRWVENLNYSARRLTQVWPTRFRTIEAAKPFANNPRALANRVYNGRMGNRPGTDDGWIYRGRCPIQATGRDMYENLTEHVGDEMGVNFVTSPDLLLNARYGFAAAAWIFAVDKGCLRHADNRNIVACTRAINGGTIGLAERKAFWERNLEILPDGFKLDNYAQMLDHYGVDGALDDAFAPDIDSTIPIEDNPEIPDFEPNNPSVTVPNPEPLPTPTPDNKKPLEGQETANTGISEDTRSTETGTPPPPSGAADNATPADGALSPQILEKERPSIFTRTMTAVFTFFGTVFTGIASYFGGNEVVTALAQKGGERIIDNSTRSDWATFGMVVLYVVVIGGVGLLLFYIASEIYQRSADRSNKLNQEKIRAAADKQLNTVEFKK